MDAALDGLVGAVCRTAADAGPTNNYCFTSDVLTETLDDGLLTIVANNCPDHVWGQGSNASTAYDDDGRTRTFYPGRFGCMGMRSSNSRP